jgi:glycosyltransferase involved in cell wall biosynthesis
MKVAQVSSHYRPVIGGQEVYIKNLNHLLAEDGNENQVYQLYRGERGDDAVCFPRILFAARFIPGFESRWLNGCISLTRPKGLFSADVIISHYAIQARPLASVSSKTIILSHGVEWGVDLQSSFDRIREENAKWCLNRFPHVVNDTHYLRHLGIEAEPAKNYFTEISPGKWFIPNCVDTTHFSPGEGMPEFKGKKMILVPRQMVVDRGIHLAIEAFALVAEKYPQVEMCLLGKRWNAANPYIRMLDELIEKFGLQDRVYFRDPVPNFEMPAWYRSACVTLIPTLRREGTSLSALESMSCGIATVSTNVVGLADLPTLQCEPEAEAVASALLQALSNSAEIGREQREIVCKTLNLDNWADCWKSVIHSVAGK